MTVKVEWNSKPVINAIDKNVAKTEKRIAQMVRRTAMALTPKRSGTLRSEIKVSVSKFKGGGYYVQPQGPRNYTRYYASFVEFGTSHTGAQPYMRPAIKKNERLGHIMLKRSIE